MRTGLKKLFSLWKDKQDFTFLLSVLVVYMFIVIPLIDEKFSGRLTFMAFYFIFLISGIKFVNRQSSRALLHVFSGLPFLLLFTEFFISSVWLVTCADLLIVFYCVCLGAIILQRTFSKGHVNVRRVQGAIIVYLLSGLIFALIYHAIFLLQGPSAFTGLVTHQRKEFLYYSLTSLTTLGYGDILPVNIFARSFSNLEALIGQLYPAVLIARLVSMEFAKSGEGEL